MDAYSKAEQFLKYPFDPHHGMSTVSKWAPPESSRIENDGNSVRASNTTSAYKNIICHFPSSDTTPEYLCEVAGDQFMDGRDKDSLRMERCDVMLPDHVLGMDFGRHGEAEIRPYIINTNQHDVIATESDADRVQLPRVKYDVGLYHDLEPLLHLNLHDLRMPLRGEHHQVKGYSIVNLQ
ncbi:uncharacterized protein LOC117338270 [Pecten maximus]|uniref:uncharacterized protein LOC117338270 n=1 Tax=Pecten maximus TaxID=6579 RepID=UPI00145917A9|nr:uncharacterized protein LOC117338270 [Pecten maximus]